MNIPDKAVSVAQEAVAKRLEAWSWYATDSASRAMALDILLVAAPFIAAKALRDEAERRVTVAHESGDVNLMTREFNESGMLLARADDLEAQ